MPDKALELFEYWNSLSPPDGVRIAAEMAAIIYYTIEIYRGDVDACELYVYTSTYVMGGLVDSMSYMLEHNEYALFVRVWRSTVLR